MRRWTYKAGQYANAAAFTKLQRQLRRAQYLPPNHAILVRQLYYAQRDCKIRLRLSDLVEELS